MRALQVDALARRVSGDENLHLFVLPKALLALGALFAPRAAVNCDDGFGPAQQRANSLGQIVERVTVLGKDDEFAPMRWRVSVKELVGGFGLTLMLQQV